MRYHTHEVDSSVPATGARNGGSIRF